MNKHRYVRAVIVTASVLLAQCTGYDTGPRYSGNEIANDTLLAESYRELYRSVYERDEHKIRPYLDHKLIEVKKQAWRALAHTPVDSLDRYISIARKSRLKVPWFALSLHTFRSEQLRSLERYWEDNPEKRGGVSLVLGRQGDKQSMEFLIRRLDESAGRSYEFQYALAIGRLMVDFKLPAKRQIQLMTHAFSAKESMLTRAYLYGYYRGEQQVLPPNVEDHLYKEWQKYGPGASSLVDQYVVRILKGRVFDEVTGLYHRQGLLAHNVQLGIELGQTAAEIAIDSVSVRSIERLLGHENPHVVRQTLLSLEGRVFAGTRLYRIIRGDLVASGEVGPFVWLQALSTISEADFDLVEQYREKLEGIMQANPYLTEQVLELYGRSGMPDRFLDRVQAVVRRRDPLRSMHAYSALEGYWNGLDEELKTAERAEMVRDLVFTGLEMGDRGVAYTLAGLLSDGSLFRPADFQRINSALGAFSLPEDIEVYQEFGELYRNRFPEQARPVIDSLASLGNAPLNRSLSEQGWEVGIPDRSLTNFRPPDWARLWKLGVDPIWVLETDKGDINIQMDLLAAPATVSAIDSLTRAGAYDGVPFHRVVPNFVIQGGDVERADGFGGPDYVIPTEANETGYYRGAAGIASAGPDTEGSQYFIMHQWKPHLNGRYTLFGVVKEGMNVVDRIVVGDTVRTAYWE